MLDTSRYPALVLNADFTPLSLIKIEKLSWEDAIHAVINERIIVVEEYDRTLRSPSVKMKLPSVVALRAYVSQERPAPYSRLNLYVRDVGRCGYCGLKLMMDEMTKDHVIPQSRGGASNFLNLVASCGPCNLLKRDRTPKEAGMHLIHRVEHPTIGDLNRSARKLKLDYIERAAAVVPAWRPYLLG